MVHVRDWSLPISGRTGLTKPNPFNMVLQMKFILLPLLSTLAALAADTGPDMSKVEKSLRETLGLLIAADMSNPPGSEARGVALLAKILKNEGVAYEISEFAPGRQNLVARLKGSGEKRPLLLLAHLDVVPATGQNWTTPPHKLVEKDGYLYGRGVGDDLGMAALNLEVFLAVKRSGLTLKRDLILAFTGDEESGGLGLVELLKKDPSLSQVELTLNEGGGPVLDEHGKVKYVELQVAEKIYQDFEVTAAGKTGHSSVPQKDNAIYRLANALVRLEKHKPVDRLLPVTRAFFLERSRIEAQPLAGAMRAIANAKGAIPPAALAVVVKDPALHSLLHTTCVATMLSAGTKVNALPPTATANVNCRLLPDETIDGAKERLKKILADPGLVIEAKLELESAGASSVTGAVPAAVRDVVKEMWPNAPVIPFMSRGATDSRFLRQKGVHAYGISPLATTEEDAMRAHGIDERIPVASVRSGMDFALRLVTRLLTD